MSKISATILNWKRLNNVRRIVTELDANELVSEIFVVNNNPSQTITTREMPAEKARIVNSSRDLGLFTRFQFPLLASTDCCLIIDDDNIFKTGELARLYSAWSREPDILHGKHGRRPKLDNTYATDVRGSKLCPIVLTRVLMLRRSYCAAFFHALEWFRDYMLKYGKTAGNGEDILMSYVVMKHTGQMNKVHDLKMQELPAPHAIHGRWFGHAKYRTELMRLCQEWLKDDHLRYPNIQATSSTCKRD